MLTLSVGISLVSTAKTAVDVGNYHVSSIHHIAIAVRNCESWGDIFEGWAEDLVKFGDFLGSETRFDIGGDIDEGDTGVILLVCFGTSISETIKTAVTAQKEFCGGMTHHIFQEGEHFLLVEVGGAKIRVTAEGDDHVPVSSAWVSVSSIFSMAYSQH